MSTTTSTTKAKLSCNHVQAIEGPVEVGDRVDCERCSAGKPTPRSRRVKKITGTPVAEMPVTAAELVEALAEPETTPDAVVVPKDPEPDGSYDLMVARDEWKALKAWEDGGKVGDRPSTGNLDAMNAAHAAGKPRSGRKARKAAGQARTVHPLRQLANDARKAKGFAGRTGRKVTQDELLAHIRKVRSDQPDASREDVLEHAYWVVELAVSRGRWNKAWDEAQADS